MKQKRFIFKLLNTILYFTIVLFPLINTINKRNITKNFREIQLKMERSDFNTLSENISNLKYNCDTVQYFVSEHPLDLELDFNCKLITFSSDSTQTAEFRKEFTNKVHKTLMEYVSQQNRARNLFLIVIFIGLAMFRILQTIINKKTKLE